MIHVTYAGVFNRGMRVTLVTNGFSFVEGPSADARGNVFFSDIPNNRVWVWTVKNELKEFIPYARGPNGTYHDRLGRLVVCEGGTRRIARYRKDGKSETIVSRYKNKLFNSPNDLWIDPKGGIWFTDPRYGSEDDVQLDGYYVFYVPPHKKEAKCVIDDLQKPNGIIGTPDGNKLYVADWGAGTTYVYNIVADGVLSNRQVFAVQQCDGMTLDEDGNVYLTAEKWAYATYVTVYAPDGTRLDRVHVPEKPTNVTFGGKDGKTLFITAGRSLYSIRLAEKGKRPKRLSSFRPYEGANKPIGKGRGVHPGRVVWMYNPAAAEWDGSTETEWWTEESTPIEEVEKMLTKGICALTGQKEIKKAWQYLFAYCNYRARGNKQGYQPGERVTIKGNFVQSMSSYAAPHGYLNCSPQIVKSLLRQLVNQCGIAQSNITVYDSITFIDDSVYAYCTNEFPLVIFADKSGENGRHKAEADTDVSLYFANNTDWKVNLPHCVTHADYLINLASLKSHQIGGVTLCAKNHFGSFCASPAFLHEAIDAENIERKDPNPLVELIGHKDLGEKTMLFMIDGLYGGQGWEGYIEKWRMPPFLNDWPSTLLLSQDPVAIDSVGLDIISTEFSIPQNSDVYLHEAAVAYDPPSKVEYDPERDKKTCESLGVHEHWNNGRDKKYSQNMGRNKGIELITIEMRDETKEK